MSDSQFGENQELLERNETQETPKPPDAEKLLDGTSKTYEFAIEYWQSSLGKKRSEIPFQGRTFAQRNSLIQENLNKLQTNDEREDSDVHETPQDEPINREELILETTELVIEQALADMVEAQRQFAEAATLVQEYQDALNAGELADVTLLEAARDVVFDLHASAIILEHYLARANDDVNGYDQFSRQHGVGERYTQFMRHSLEEYRVQSESTFAADQEQDQLESTFEREIERVANASKFGSLLQALNEEIQEQKAGNLKSDSEPEQEAPEQQEVSPEKIDAQEILDGDEEKPQKENPFLRFFRGPRREKRDKAD